MVYTLIYMLIQTTRSTNFDRATNPRPYSNPNGFDYQNLNPTEADFSWMCYMPSQVQYMYHSCKEALQLSYKLRHLY